MTEMEQVEEVAGTKIIYLMEKEVVVFEAWAEEKYDLIRFPLLCMAVRSTLADDDSIQWDKAVEEYRDYRKLKVS